MPEPFDAADFTFPSATGKTIYQWDTTQPGSRVSGLRKSCEHGFFSKHYLNVDDPTGEGPDIAWPECSFEPTINDCIAWLRAQGADGVIRIEYRGPKGEPFHVDVNAETAP